MNNNFNINDGQSKFNDVEPEHDWKAHSQRHGGLLGEAAAERLLERNDALYKEMKGDWTRTHWNKSNNIKTTTHREGGKLFLTREQLNCDYIAEICADYRKFAEEGWLDPLAPMGEDGKLTYKWMELPDIIAKDIGEKYFGGMQWSTIKLDRVMKAQFYMVVEKEYNQYVCHPTGKLPLPLRPAYPTKGIK